MGGVVRLIASTDDTSYELSEIKWLAGSGRACKLCALGVRIADPPEKFADRLTNHDGAIINALIERKIARRPRSRSVDLRDGRQPANPKCSVVVPLYGRHDLHARINCWRSPMIRILSRASSSSMLSSTIIGSSRRWRPMRPMFEASFGVPFRTIWSGENRGFSGATNLGVANSRAPFVLLMNSDVIPIASGWLERMRSVLAAHPEIGMLGARLHHPNGAVEHDGMGFQWEPTWQSYLNSTQGQDCPDRLRRRNSSSAKP